VPTAAEVARIRQLLERHAEETDSPVARTLADALDEELAARFTTLMPRDYARVLRARSDAELAGLDEETTVKLMMEASHG
jgi:glutamate synthase (NADPH/NADH) large chain